MTTEPTDPKPAPGTSFSKPVLVAGLLGGLLGAVCSFALARSLPPPVTPPPPAPPSEARQYAEQVLNLLRSGKHDDFMEQLRPAFPEASAEQFAAVRDQMYKARESDAKSLGAGAEFEYARESSLGPTLVRVIFLEKYPRGCKVWSLIVYQSPSGWQVVSCDVRAPGAATGPPLQ